MTTEVFYPKKYGQLIRSGRLKMGFQKPDELVPVLYARTRVSIAVPTLYRIESGSQAPTLIQFLALNFVVWNELFPMDKLAECFCPEWRFMWANEMPPDSWIVENLLSAMSEHDLASTDGQGNQFVCIEDVESLAKLREEDLLPESCEVYPLQEIENPFGSEAKALLVGKVAGINLITLC